VGGASGNQPAHQPRPWAVWHGAGKESSIMTAAQELELARDRYNRSMLRLDIVGALSAEDYYDWQQANWDVDAAVEASKTDAERAADYAFMAARDHEQTEIQAAEQSELEEMPTLIEEIMRLTCIWLATGDTFPRVKERMQRLNRYRDRRLAEARRWAVGAMAMSEEIA